MNFFTAFSQPPSIDTTNNGVQAKTVPLSLTYTIGANYESVILRRVFVLGRLVLNGRLSVIF